MECLRGDFLQFSRATVKTLILGCQLETCLHI